MGRSIGLQGPDLHLSESLTAELSLAAQRLLGYQGVGAGRTRVNLVVDQVMQLQIVHVSDGRGPVKGLTGTAVAQLNLAVPGDGNSLPQGSVVAVLREIIHGLLIQDLLVLALEVLPGLIDIVVGHFQRISDLALARAVEDRRLNIEAEGLGG